MLIQDISGPVTNTFELTRNYLWNIRSDTIFLHDVRDEKKFSVLYELETYDYVFENLVKTGFQYAVSPESGYVYVVANKSINSTNTTQILIYSEIAQNIQNLYAVIDTGITFDRLTSSVIFFPKKKNHSFPRYY